MAPSPTCVRCGKNDTGPANFLLTCSECRKAWHHRCHIPPIEEAELIARVKATMANDVDNGLDGWMCKRCKKNQGKAEGGSATAQPTAPPKDAPVSHIPQKRPADVEVADVERVRVEPPVAQAARPPVTAAAFRPYSMPPHMREASETISKPETVAVPRAPAHHPLPPRPTNSRPQAGVSKGRPSRPPSAGDNHAHRRIAQNRAGPSTRPPNPADASTATVPDSQDPRTSHSSRSHHRPPSQPTHRAPSPHMPPAPAPSIPFDSTGRPDFRSIASRLRASGRLDPPAFERALHQLSTPAREPSAPASPPKPEPEDYDMEDLYWPPRPPAAAAAARPPSPPAAPKDTTPAPRPPEAAFPTPTSLSPAPGPRGKAPYEYMRSKVADGEDAATAALVRAWMRMRVRDPDAPRRPRKAPARRLGKKEKRRKAFVLPVEGAAV